MLKNGGGMTVALSDIVFLVPMIAAEPDLADWRAATDALHRWLWARKRLTAMANILGIALYDLLGVRTVCPTSCCVCTRLTLASYVRDLKTNTSSF